ncbi:hypothetical protein ACHQM5_000570 [Ranunculus cassubicifolius]
MKNSGKKSNDRISQLPDDVLGSILCFLPEKHAIRTSILSKRWTSLWESIWVHATNFDFGKEFAQAQSQEQFAATVNKYLLLHTGESIDKFRVYFPLGEEHKSDLEKWFEFATTSKGVKEGEEYRADIEKWIEFATSKGVKELDLSCIISFNQPSGFTCSGSLQTLRLNRVGISDETLESLINNCPALTNLCLRLCFGLGSIKVSSLSLRCLSVIHSDAYEIDIFAPNLKSLHFSGDIFYGYSFRNIAALDDFFISADGGEHTEMEHDFMHILSEASHVKVLTTCIGAPMHITVVEEYDLGPLPIALPNLRELQILIGGKIGEEYLGYVFNFFRKIVCPSLDKIFIDLSGPYIPLPQYDVEQAEVPLSCVFSNLKTIKINQFRGSDTEMKMVKFFLQSASALELLVLVAVSSLPAQNDANGDKTPHSEKTMKLLLDELAALLNSSSKVQILLFDHGEVDTSLTPVHTHTDYIIHNT